jgi:transcription-repair coupling factor (superfamily II helicase)
LGSGYYVALSDLDIRGAGSLFGYRQSGDGGVGFELYSKLVGLALNKGVVFDCVVDIYNNSLSGVIGNEGQRGYFYKCVFDAQTKEELEKIKKDFVHIFGCCPKAFICLLKNRELGILAAKKRILKILKKGGVIVVVFAEEQIEGFVKKTLLYVASFFKDRGLGFRFLRAEKNLTFQYNCLGENDYILLLSFINNLSF